MFEKKFKPKAWHIIFYPSIPFFTAWGFLHRYGFDLSTAFLAGCLFLMGIVLLLYLLGVAIIQALDETQIPADVTELLKPQPRTLKGYQNLQIKKWGWKWQRWARQILEGMEFTGALWYGRGKLFSRDEYEEGISTMLNNNVIVFSNGKTSDNGYTINGEGGRAYLVAMAEGRDILPKPQASPLPQ